MLGRVLIIFVVGILLSDYLLGDFPPKQVQSVRQDAYLSVKIGEKLSDAGIDTETVALAQGMLLGDKSNISRQTIQDLRRAGMSHLMAVSGLHIGILWGMIWLLLLPFNLLSSRGWQRLLIILVLWAYIMAIGAPASAVRAGIMISMVHVAWFLHRNVWAFDNLWSAALLILLFNPNQLYQVGFQLSFLSVAGILTVKPRNLLTLTLSTQLYTFPLCAFYFHYVPLFGWLQGIMVVPVLAIFIYLILALLLTELCVSGATIPLLPTLAGWISWYITHVAQWTVLIEDYCLGGKLEWHPSLVETIAMESAIVVGVLLYKWMDYQKCKRTSTPI